MVVKNTFLTFTGNDEDSISDATRHGGLKTAPASLQPPGCLAKAWDADFSGFLSTSKLAEDSSEELLSPTTDSTQPSTPPAEGILRVDSSDGFWPATPASPLKNRIQISLNELTADDNDTAMQAEWVPSVIMMIPQQACVDQGMWPMSSPWYEDAASAQMLVPCMMQQLPEASTDSTPADFWPSGVRSAPPAKSPRLPLELLLARDTEVDAPPMSPSGSILAEKDCYQ